VKRSLRTWISQPVAAELLEVAPSSVPKLAAAGGVRVQRLPGRPVRYSRSDLQRLVESSIDNPAVSPAPAA
jgi:hypothetical protein